MTEFMLEKTDIVFDMSSEEFELACKEAVAMRNDVPSIIITWVTPRFCNGMRVGLRNARKKEAEGWQRSAASPSAKLWILAE